MEQVLDCSKFATSIDCTGSALTPVEVFDKLELLFRDLHVV